MRLLQLMAGAAEGGAENFFSRLAIAVQSSPVEQHLVIRPEPERESKLSDAGINVTTARFGGRLDVATRRFLSREIEMFRPDVVLTWMNRATAFCPRAGGSGGFRHVGTPRGYYDPKYYRRCDHLVVTTDDLSRFYTGHGWSPDRVSVIPNFAPFEPLPAVSRDVFDTPADAPLLLALGRLHANKAFDTLLASLALLPDHFLWIGGVGPLENDLKVLARKLDVADRVRFLGWRNDVAALLAATDVFVCSSRHEPFGNIVIEAWMYGAPIVAAASEGPSALIEDGVTGLLAPVDDAPALAKAIARLAGEPNLAAALAEAGRRQYECHYTEEIVLPKYLNLFEGLTR
jgi:glycosyltransferase involved in cell wall biosynthesis